MLGLMLGLGFGLGLVLELGLTRGYAIGTHMICILPHTLQLIFVLLPCSFFKTPKIKRGYTAFWIIYGRHGLPARYLDIVLKHYTCMITYLPRNTFLVKINSCI